MLLAVAAFVVAAGVTILWLRRRPADPDEIERRRRTYLNQIGRIVEGQVLEIQEGPPRAPSGKQKKKSASLAPEASRASAMNGARHLIVYSYSISGVTYETAQDVTGMEERAALGKAAGGLPVSVKYDPSNPGNSILLADDWSGLH